MLRPLAIRDAGGSRTHFGPGCSRPPRREASASSQCPRQESNLALDLRRIGCASATPRGRRSVSRPGLEPGSGPSEGPMLIRYTTETREPTAGFAPAWAGLRDRCLPHIVPRRHCSRRPGSRTRQAAVMSRDRTLVRLQTTRGTEDRGQRTELTLAQPLKPAPALCRGSVQRHNDI